jgi:TM2 domain-containing membrane protein YozV
MKQIMEPMERLLIHIQDFAYFCLLFQGHKKSHRLYGFIGWGAICLLLWLIWLYSSF